MNEEDKNWQPTYEKAHFPEDKFFKYSLDKNSPAGRNKAIAFDAILGYNQGNGYDLITKVKETVEKYPITEKESDKWGRRFNVDIELEGVNQKTGNKALVKTAWIKRNGEDFLRLTTIYILRKL